MHANEVLRFRGEESCTSCCGDPVELAANVHVKWWHATLSVGKTPKLYQRT